MKTRVDMAVEVIDKIRQMTPEDLAKLLARDVGRDLCVFFGTYAEQVQAIFPQSGQSLLLLGYFVRLNEEREQNLQMIQPEAKA